MSELDKLRTILANERTLLAYIRTTLALLIFGMAAIKFFPENIFIVTFGWIVCAGGMGVLLWGLYHSRARLERIHRHESIKK